MVIKGKYELLNPKKIKYLDQLEKNNRNIVEGKTV
jgi:hypothetical protein